MKSLTRNTISIIFLSLVVSACASSGVDRKFGDIRDEIIDMRSLQADQSVAIEQIREEMKALTGKLEELEYVATGRTAQLEQTLSTVSRRMPPPAEVPQDLLQMDDAEARRMSPVDRDGVLEGLRALRMGEFDASKATFENYVSQRPGTPFADNAQFWIGISEVGLGEYDRAVVAFSEVYRAYPRGDRAPAALYFLADTFVKLGATDDAVVTLEKLRDDFSRSSYAQQAVKRIKELKTRR
ncbi:MAG: tetratricopeptide repeat protein [bacterium]|nr:tetratricopeptide repeat protein [bacterium]